MTTKRLLSAILALILLLSASGCSSTLSEEEKETETMEEITSAATTEEDLMESFHDAERIRLSFEDREPTALTAKQVSDLPFADETMTSARLRKLCVDFFQLQLSFLWEGNLDVTDYPTTYAKFNNDPKTLRLGSVYGGIPYQSTGTGNLYRWLEYYDEATGQMDLARAVAENGGYGENAVVSDVKTDENGNVTYKKYRAFRVLFNQCSVSSFWGWARVVNSADFSSTAEMNVHNGFIPVGLFTYPNMKRIVRFGTNDDANPSGYDTKDVIADLLREKGDNGLADCYALMQPADCLVSGGHAMMVKSVSVKRNAEGEVIRSQSHATVLEQIENWGKKSTLGDKPYYQQGGVNRVYSFVELQQKGYLPFTFAEFLDEADPVDKAHLDFYREVIAPLHPIADRYAATGLSEEDVAKISGERVEQAEVYSPLKDKSAVTLKELEKSLVESNYPISDVFLTVKAPDGTVLLKNVNRALTAHVRQVTMEHPLSTGQCDANGKYLPLTTGLDAFANGQNVVEAQVQLSSGHLLTAFSLTLNP